MEVTSRFSLTTILAVMLTAVVAYADGGQGPPNEAGQGSPHGAVIEPEAGVGAKAASSGPSAAAASNGAAPSRRKVLPNAKAAVAAPQTADDATAPAPVADDAVAEWLAGEVSREPSSAQSSKAETAPTGARAAASTSMFSGKGLTHLLWPLAIVLVVIAASAALFRKWGRRAGRVGGGGVIDVLARHYLSPKQSLCLVRLGRRLVLVGVSPERVDSLSEIGDSEEIAAILSAIERGRAGSFSSVLAKLSERDWRRVPEEAAAPGELPVASAPMAAAGVAVHDLIGRVRQLGEAADAGGERRSSAEPT